MHALLLSRVFTGTIEPIHLKFNVDVHWVSGAYIACCIAVTLFPRAPAVPKELWRQFLNFSFLVVVEKIIMFVLMGIWGMLFWSSWKQLSNGILSFVVCHWFIYYFLDLTKICHINWPFCTIHVHINDCTCDLLILKLNASRRY